MLARDGLMGGRALGKSSFGDGPLHGGSAPQDAVRDTSPRSGPAQADAVKSVGSTRKTGPQHGVGVTNGNDLGASRIRLNAQ